MTLPCLSMNISLLQDFCGNISRMRDHETRLVSHIVSNATFIHATRIHAR